MLIPVRETASAISYEPKFVDEFPIILGNSAGEPFTLLQCNPLQAGGGKQDMLVSTGGSDWAKVAIGIISEEKLCEHFCWRPESEHSTGPAIYLVRHRIEVANVAGDLGAFREVLADQAVGVLVGSAFPWRVGVGEIDRDRKWVTGHHTYTGNEVRLVLQQRAVMLSGVVA